MLFCDVDLPVDPGWGSQRGAWEGQPDSGMLTDPYLLASFYPVLGIPHPTVLLLLQPPLKQR